MRTAIQIAWAIVALGAFVLSVSALKDAAGYVVAGLLILIWVTWREFSRPTWERRRRHPISGHRRYHR